MEQQKLQTAKYFWLHWTLVTLAAIACVLLLFMAALGPLLNAVPPIIFGAVLGACFGSATGFAQWILLKKVFPQTYQWIIATETAWTLFWALNMAGFFGRGYNLPTKILEGVGHGIIFGLILGIAQWLVLKKWTIRAPVWVGINMAIWSVCAMIADGLRMAFQLQGPVEFFIAFPLSAILFGIAMQWFWQQPAPETSEAIVY